MEYFGGHFAGLEIFNGFGILKLNVSNEPQKYTYIFYISLLSQP